MICVDIVVVFPLATPFPVMEYIPNLSVVKNPRPAHLLGAEALNPVIVKRLEYVLLNNAECSSLVLSSYVLSVAFIIGGYIIIMLSRGTYTVSKRKWSCPHTNLFSKAANSAAVSYLCLAVHIFLFLISAHHSGLQLHFSKAASSMNKGIYYDTIFVLNTGRVTSVGPHGEINWQVMHYLYTV